MKQFVFSGHSDDLLYCGERGNEDEFYHPWHVRVISDEAEVEVKADYGANGTWNIAVGLADEDAYFPDWEMNYGRAENGYSVELRMGVPDDARIERCHY